MTLFYILIGILIIAVVIVGNNANNKNEAINEEETEDKETDTSVTTSTEYPYYKAKLLTKKEWYFYMNTLKPLAEKYNFNVLAKVRMEDIVGVKRTIDKKERASARGKVRCRHFDFIITKPDMTILLVIELDDNTHEKEKAKQIDEFKNNTLEELKIPYIRTNGKEDIEKEICEKIKSLETA